MKENVAEISANKIVLFKHPPSTIVKMEIFIIHPKIGPLRLSSDRIAKEYKRLNLVKCEFDDLSDSIKDYFLDFNVYQFPTNFSQTETFKNESFLRFFGSEFQEYNDDYKNIFIILKGDKSENKVQILELEKPFNSEKFKNLIKFNIRKVVSLTNSSFSPRQENQILNIRREGYEDSETGLPVYVKKKIFSLSPSILQNAGYKIVKK